MDVDGVEVVVEDDVRIGLGVVNFVYCVVGFVDECCVVVEGVYVLNDGFSGGVFVVEYVF